MKKLTPFGICVRKLRVDYGLTLRQMGDGMGVTASYLSAMETGEKELTEKHTDTVIQYFSKFENPAELESIRTAAAQTINKISLENLSPEAKWIVCRFVREIRNKSS